MKFKNIILKTGTEAINDSPWVKDILIEDKKGDFYPLEFITSEEVRRCVERDSFMLTIPYRLIVNHISLEFIFEAIQELEDDDFFKYKKPISQPDEADKKGWKTIDYSSLSRSNREKTIYRRQLIAKR